METTNPLRDETMNPLSADLDATGTGELLVKFFKWLVRW